MSNKSLQRKIKNKLEKLQEILDDIDEARNIELDEPDTWDSDTLYNLIENSKEIIKLLEDQQIKGKYDEFNQPLYEKGLCSLVDEYQNEEEENEDDF